MIGKRTEPTGSGFFMEWIEVPAEIYIRSSIADNPSITTIKHASIHIRQDGDKWVFFFSEMGHFYENGICVGCGDKQCS